MQKTIITGARATVMCFGFAVITTMPVPATGQAHGSRDLAQSDLADLMNTDVTSVSRKEQKLSQAAAAVFVISQDDIRRSGATTIPDLLRMAPGVNVARIDAETWAISIRGFSELYADKVLVLIDGRSVYRDSFSGVRWNEIDLPLEDIERIEVVRGPGGTVWGANAMNGVINIITKNSRDTQGGLVTAGSGSQTSAEGLSQYGGRMGSGGAWRAFGKYFNIDNSTGSEGGHGADGWHGFHEGFRTDWDLSTRDTMTVQGDVLKVEGGRVLTGLVAFDSIPLVQNSARDRIGDTSANLMGRWNHTLSNGSTTSLQIYGDYNSALAQGSLDKSRTFDVDFSHHVSIGSRNDIVWGAGARAVESDFVKGKNVAFLPPHRIDSLVSAFVQDEIRITDALSFTLGSKFEHNSYTGFEYEPSAQLAWEVTERQTIWASASRAIRQPARLDYGVLADLAAVPLDNGGFGIVQLQGTPHPKAEKMRDFELGHRAQLNKRVSLDSAAFVSLYHSLAAFEPGAAYFTTAEGPPHLVFPEVFDNKARGQDYGVEIFTNWNVINRWQLSPGYSWLHMRVTDPTGVGILREDPGLNPRHQPQLRSSLNLSRGLEWDASLAYTGRLNAIPAYTRFDTRIGWRASESIEFSLVGQNLLSPHHSEYPDADFITHTRVDRNVFGKVSWRF